MDRKEDIERLNDKLDTIIYNQEKARELTDLSNLENTNFAIFISILAIVFSVIISFDYSITNSSIVPIFLLVIIFVTLTLIFNEVYLIYKDDIRKRFNFFYKIIYFLINLAFFPFLIFFLNYFGELYHINKIYLLIITFISSSIFAFFVTIMIATYVFFNVELIFMKRFPKIYTESFKDSLLFKVMVKFISDKLMKSIELMINEAFESAIKDEINKIDNNKKNNKK